MIFAANKVASCRLIQVLDDALEKRKKPVNLGAYDRP